VIDKFHDEAPAVAKEIFTKMGGNWDDLAIKVKEGDYEKTANYVIKVVEAYFAKYPLVSLTEHVSVGCLPGASIDNRVPEECNTY